MNRLKFLSSIFYELQTVFDIYITLSVLAIGLFIIFVDSKNLKNKKLKKEARFAKALGIIYAIGGPLLYIVLKLVFKLV